MENFKHKGLTVKIFQDELPLNPRKDYDCWLGTMACWHRRYKLGDVQPRVSPDDYLLSLMQEREFQKGKHVPDEIKKENLEAYINKHFYVLPLYLMDHSGISISTTPFSCGWDRGRVGFIHGLRDEMECYQNPVSILESEVKSYNYYLTGECYSYLIENENGDALDSCHGYIGEYEECKKEAIDSADKIASNLVADFCI